MNVVMADLARSNGDLWVQFGDHRLRLDPSTLERRPGLSRFESRQVIWSALNDFDEADRVDFADALIVHKARATADRTDRPYRGTYTFDKAVLALEGTVVM